MYEDVRDEILKMKLTSGTAKLKIDIKGRF